ncbi:MAG: tetratricopeptide repeat protein [Nitrospinae bacterium]|nr:tetratricopeptide repeat protein [Nitrospinota bacterium]MBL7019794.1 tetratricopeptide repeat protein [Nitrospinaceae bacterium]
MTLLILISMLTYFNSLKGSFQFDDAHLINSQWLLNTDAFFDHPLSAEIGRRPVLNWTFALNNQLARHKVFGFHLFNLALHIGVTLLIFFIIGRAKYLLNKCGWVFPLTTALLFSLHPLNTDSVSYISSRSSLLATFFYLLTLYIFLNLFCPKKITPFTKKLPLSLLILAGIYLSVASKLIGATLPFMLAVWYWGFIGRKQYPNFHKAAMSNRSAFIGLTLVTIISTGVIIFGDSWIHIPFDQGFELFGRAPYFIVQLKVIVFYYLKLFYFPFNLNVDSGFPFSSAMTDPAIIFSGLIILASILAILKWRNVWVVVGAIWFFITLAPTSSFIPLNDLAVEHRMYLPMSLGLSLVAGVGIKTLPMLWRLRLLVVLLIALGATTAARNADWVSELSLWKDSATKNPFSPRPHNNAGKAYYEKGDLAQASYHFEKSVANIPRFVANQYNIQDPKGFLERRNKVAGKNDENKLKSPSSLKIMAELVEPHYNLASVYLDQGRLDEAEEEYLKTQALRPGHFSSKIGLSSVYNQKGLYDQAVSLLEQAVQENITSSDPGFALARLNLGELYGKTGKIADAITEWEAALKIDPSLLPAHFNLGTAYMMTGKLESAENAFKHCLKLNSRYEPALFNLAKVYQMQEKWDESTQLFKVFLEVTGPRPSAFTQIGFNFNRQSDWKNAQIYFEKSVSLQPDNINVRIYLAEALASLGHKEKAKEHLQAASNPNPAQSAAINKMMLSLTGPQNTTP